MDYILIAVPSAVIGVLVAMIVCHVDKDRAFNDGVDFGIGLGRAFADKERGK